jgi:hypothetical protein
MPRRLLGIPSRAIRATARNRSLLLWQKLLSGVLTKLGLQAGKEESYIFLNNYLIVFFFVNDIYYIFRACD